MGGVAKQSLEEREPAKLVELLGSEQFPVSQAAADRLFQQGGAAVEVLVEGLSHPNWRVRKNCAGLMDHLGDDRCIEPLRRALQDPIVGVRRLAVHALGCQPCKLAPLQVDIISLLIEATLSDPSIRVRRVAAHMLGLQPYDARAVAALETLLAEETDAPLLSRAQRALYEQEQKAESETASSCPRRSREGEKGQ